MEEQKDVGAKGIVLPTGIEKASRTNLKNWVMYGLEKSGKTTLLSKLPGCLIIDTEGGTDYTDALKLVMPQDYGPKSKRQWLKDVAKKIKDEGRPYDHVAIDTFSELDTFSEWWGTTDYMKSNIGKSFNRVDGVELKYGHPDYLSVLTTKGTGDFSPGYKWMRDAMLDMFDTLTNLGRISTIFVCHVTDKMVAKEVGKEVMTKDLALTGKVRSIVSRRVDATANVWSDKGQMMISFVGNADKIGGVRAPHLTGYSGPADWSKIFVEE